VISKFSEENRIENTAGSKLSCSCSIARTHRPMIDNASKRLTVHGALSTYLDDDFSPRSHGLGNNDYI